MSAGSDPDHEVTEQPVMWLGMSGFSPNQRAGLQAALERPAGVPKWRVSGLEGADAWWVNGAKVKVMPDGNLKVGAGLPTEHALQLNLDEVDRPVAFAAPLAPPEFEPRCMFDPQSEASIKAALLQFDTWLRPLRAQFVLGGQVISRAAAAKRGIFHVSHHGTLLAVLDFQEGKAAISPQAHPVDIAEAQWDRRPVGARDAPETFTRATLSQLAWTNVRRTDRDMLPPRYRTQTIYYCHVPGVPLRWLRDSQLMVLRELSAEAGTLQELGQRTGLPEEHLAHDLSCLYYAGSITSTRGKAARGQPAPRQDSLPFGSGRALASAPASDLNPGHHDMTAPALLEHRHTPLPGKGASAD